MSLMGSLLLAAIMLLATAHGRFYPTHSIAKVLVTSLLAKGAAAIDGSSTQFKEIQRSLDNSIAVGSPSSVVQDWSLVCKQLCGAGLGGMPCALHCMTSEVPNVATQAKAEIILNKKKDTICQDLCELQLGDPICHCNSVATTGRSIAVANNYNGVCSSFCDQNQVTLAGCSLCQNSEVLAAGDDASNHFRGIVAVDATEAPVTTTTPNWDELCVILCKTGDGGSLCNCDLSPFAH